MTESDQFNQRRRTISTNSQSTMATIGEFHPVTNITAAPTYTHTHTHTLTHTHTHTYTLSLIFFHYIFGEPRERGVYLRRW